MNRYRVVPKALRVSLYTQDELFKIHNDLLMKELYRWANGQQGYREAFEKAIVEYNEHPLNKRGRG